MNNFKVLSFLILAFAIEGPLWAAGPASVELRCQFPLNSPSVWNSADHYDWHETTSFFRDQTAAFISTTSANAPAAGAGYCESLQPGQKQVLISSVEIRRSGNYLVELLGDDVATLRVVRSDGSGAQEIVGAMNNYGGTYTASSFLLSEGSYSLILENEDMFGTASAVVASLQSPDGKVIKHTALDGSWTAYLIPSKANSLDLLRR